MSCNITDESRSSFPMDHQPGRCRCVSGLHSECVCAPTWQPGTCLCLGRVRQSCNMPVGPQFLRRALRSRADGLCNIATATYMCLLRSIVRSTGRYEQRVRVRVLLVQRNAVYVRRKQAVIIIIITAYAWLVRELVILCKVPWHPREAVVGWEQRMSWLAAVSRPVSFPRGPKGVLRSVAVVTIHSHGDPEEHPLIFPGRLTGLECYYYTGCSDCLGSLTALAEDLSFGVEEALHQGLRDHHQVNETEMVGSTP